MDAVPEVRTERLLRGWRESDKPPFAKLNADPEVMRWFPGTLTRDESDGMVDRNVAYWASHDHGLWAVEPLDGDHAGVCIDFIGLMMPPFDAHFTPAVEVGWRLTRGVWGRGYAPEGARAALAYGFETLDLDEIVSMTAVGNDKSRRVMEKIGMTRDPGDDFDHPRVAVGSPIRRHVLYRLRRDDWRV